MTTAPDVTDVTEPRSFEPDLELKAIRKHPLNPRHKAVADAELVESVRVNGLIEPLIVVPERDEAGYLLIAGHRRLDALKKAKYHAAPAIVRHDLVTPQQQLEAMLVENDNREDLTPIEQAEGYQQLQLDFGYTQKAIATAVGKDTKTVRTRLQLLKLAKPTQRKVHERQLSIDDALALVEFADDPKATRKLEKAVADGHSIKYELERARTRRTQKAQLDEQVAKLKARSVPEYKIPKGKGIYHLDDATRVAQMSVDEGEHTDCLAYAITPEDQWYPPQLHLVCTDPARHDDQATAQQQKVAADRAQAEAQAQARREAVATAARLRVAIVCEQVDVHATYPAGLITVMRALLPALLNALFDEPLTAYQDVMNIPDSDRWRNNWQRDETKVQAHIADIDRWSPGVLVRAVAAAITGTAENAFEESIDGGQTEVRRYQELLETLDHDFCDLDRDAFATALDDEEAS